MDPSPDEFQAIWSLADIGDWVGFVDDALPTAEPEDQPSARLARSSFLRALGSPRLIRQVVAIPLAAFEVVVANWRVDVVDQQGATLQAMPTAVESGHPGVFRRVARLVLALPPDVSAPSLPPLASGLQGSGSQLASAPPLAAVTGSGSKKVLLSKVLDQNEDAEIPPMEAAVYRSLIDEWIATANEGEEPLEEEEATSDQLTALQSRCKTGAAPYVDFGVWRPFEKRLGRALRFVIHLPKPDGTLQAREINGPDSYELWLKCWRVFVFAMSVLKLATASRLSRYSERIRALAEDYPRHWWVIGLADIRMRSEGLEKVRRQCVRRKAAGDLTDFDDANPWGVVFREAAADETYWSREVDRKITQIGIGLASASSLADAGFGPLVERAAPVGPGGAGGVAGRGLKRPARVSDSEETMDASKKTPKAKKRAAKRTRQREERQTLSHQPPGGRAPERQGRADPDRKRPDGRFVLAADGRQICFSYAHNLGGGCATDCPNHRAHVCEFCREAHRSIDCRNKPQGWTPP